MLSSAQTSPQTEYKPLLSLKPGLRPRENSRLQTLGVLSSQKHEDLVCTVFVKRSRIHNSEGLMHFVQPQMRQKPVQAQVENTAAAPPPAVRKARGRKGSYLRLASIRSR